MENINEKNNKTKMKWQKDLDSYFNIYSTFIIDGYIDDVQPCVDPDTGIVTNKTVSEYLADHYGLEGRANQKCVIIYDPTESTCKRFDIKSKTNISDLELERAEFMERQAQEGHENEVESEYNIVYNDPLAQHFWEILHEDEVADLLIEHNTGDPSLDFARIHYAVTENGRLNGLEVLSKFLNFRRYSEQNSDKGYLFVIKMTSRLLGREGSNHGLSRDELLIFRQLLSISQALGSHMEHKLIVLANKSTDLPMWFTDEIMNPYVKKLTITKPTKENKEAFFDQMIENFSFGDEFDAKYQALIAENSEAESDIKRKFCAYTNDFTMKSLEQYKEFITTTFQIDDPEKLGYSISTFKAGELINPWDDEKTVNDILNVSEIVSHKIKGQDQALVTVQNILTNAAVGLGRAENPNAPRVVLFLAGPTGTGKTEICKQLAKAIFGSEDRIVRFDMSEYGQDHSDQKLFGAPPGYVGYEEGGKLTNAIKKEPFSLVLFDEIEKAHPSILDKFLQILGDGRLTDGHGETVSFTDSIIAITSNAGVTSPTPKSFEEEEEIRKKMGGDLKPAIDVNMRRVIELEKEGKSSDEIYNEVKEYLRYNVKYYFNCQLNRPELYGRIEDALVYYNYIGKDSVGAICAGKFKTIMKFAKNKYKLADVILSDEVKDAVIDYCQGENVRSMGARGIGKAVSKTFESSLSNFFKPYERGFDEEHIPHTKSELINKTIECYVEKESNGELTHKDIKWRIR